MNLKTPKLIILFLIGGLLFQACSIFGSNSSEDVLFDQTGTLSWNGPPAADGAGILFETKSKTYGAPGNREDYNDYFPENKNQVQVIADIKLTGETTTRGWGSEYPEITFLEIKIGK
ncbi:hypothetical protein LQ318_06370 [Aliifodinibius salicampi]|uniref:Uncharacterized protein n=1 Tax=Fodinibius salicampi TaxID=1920655 RepID=A0ABT3PXE6_9BACT|nr:hypothetical protein [Fodinibius salicampi]MCW9712523.1 hypothetical protein [Fodinibius salicampi]